MTVKYKRCSKKGIFIVGHYYYCGTHKKQPENKNCKNTLKSRIGSIRYSAAMTLFSLLQENDVTNTANINSINVTECFYCECSLLNTVHSVDHIFPVIVNRKPNTKYICSHMNLVHCCGSCNSNKGNRDIMKWMKAHKNEKIINPTKIQTMSKRIETVPDIPSDVYAKMLFKFETCMDAFVQAEIILND